MVGDRLSAYRDRVRDGLEAAFSEELPPEDVAWSFSFGIFVAALPNFGTALILFALLARYVDRVSKLALLAAIFVMNPPVKWGVYAAGFWIGVRFLGPVPGISTSEPSLSLSAGPAVLSRVFVGSLLVATIAAGIGYVVALRSVRRLRARDAKFSETVADVLRE